MERDSQIQKINYGFQETRRLEGWVKKKNEGIKRYKLTVTKQLQNVKVQ